jgi:hypothetical protein
MKGRLSVMGRNSVMGKLGLVFILVSLASSAGFASGGGENIPSLNDINTMKFELADGEAYQIAGEIVMTGNQPYLLVDLKAQPWLATPQRVSFPYYALSGSSAFWVNYVGKHVAYLCVAEGDIINGEYQITLRPIKNAACDTLVQEIAGKPHR